MKQKVKAILIVGLCLFLNGISLQAQSAVKDSIDCSFKFKGDFRFRVEQDWDSRKSDGTYRKDRSRLRYRLRFGFTKQIDPHFSVGARLRTGKLNDQQGPHLTLGGNDGEFGLTQIGFEKIYLKYSRKNVWLWMGKNSYPFWKQNELLWNDNVFPEGIAIGLNNIGSKRLVLKPTLGHFIFRSGNTLFQEDAYLSSIQLHSQLRLGNEAKLLFNLGNLYFHNFPDLPDKQHTYLMNYNIVTASMQYQIPLGKTLLAFGLDGFFNTTGYQRNEDINTDYEDEKNGYVATIQYGRIKQRGDWMLQVCYAHIEKYAIVDYLAQNDWARWDYSGVGASGSRLSNFQGVELKLGYQLRSNINLIARYYQVEQLVKLGQFKENGQRFRIDLNAKF
ncbi:MAG: putative porin [Bacteroidota bacterium]